MKRLALLLSVMLLAASPLIVLSLDTSAEEYAQPDDIRVSPSKNNVDLKAGDSIRIYLDIYNRFHEPVIVYVYYTDRDPDITIDFPDGHRVEIDGHDLGFITLDIAVSKYARSTDHELTFDIGINHPPREAEIEADASHSLMISVTSELSAGKQYNKIMGVIDNNLPSPLNGPAATALVTIAIWILIAIVVAYGAVPLVLNAFNGFTKGQKGGDGDD